MANGLTQRRLSSFTLGRLARFYEASQRQLPRVIDREELDPATLGCRRWKGSELRKAHIWYFALASGQVLPALSLDVASGPLDTIPLLEDLYYADVTVADVPLARWSSLAVAERFGCRTDGGDFLPECHQLLYASIPTPAHVPTSDQLQRVIYRADLPCRPEYSSIRYPTELNRRPTTVAALGPYVSVIAGQQDYVENTVLLSAVQAVGSLARLLEIRHRAYECVETLKLSSTKALNLRDRRLIVEETADTLGDLEVELSFSVEATADLGMLVPSLRVESYHDSLYESMRLARSAATTGNMLERLRNSIADELTSIESVENRADDARRIRMVAAVTFVTTVGGTLSVLFGFFGVNATEVDQNRSMFSSHYVWIYVTILLVIVGAVALYAGMRWQERRQDRRDRRRQHAWLPSKSAPSSVPLPGLPRQATRPKPPAERARHDDQAKP
jgi:hypothetical protein